VFGPDDVTYTNRLATYYSANAALPPWCMVLPTSTEDVSEVAKVLHEFKCPFGMRSGAHSAFTGSNGVDDGITVDFSKSLILKSLQTIELRSLMADRLYEHHHL
jgi:FAD/FMN-containing dehydrogenase